MSSLYRKDHHLRRHAPQKDCSRNPIGPYQIVFERTQPKIDVLPAFRNYLGDGQRFFTRFSGEMIISHSAGDGEFEFKLKNSEGLRDLFVPSAEMPMR